MHFEDFLTADNVWITNSDLTVETARAQKRRVKNVRAVGCRDDDNTFIGFEAVHLNEKLVQRLLTLIITTANTGAARTTDSVNLVDEDDAWCVFLRLLEHVADTACADTHKHFNKVRTGNREEWNVRFTRNSACCQGFTCTRRANKQRTFRNLTAKALEL